MHADMHADMPADTWRQMQPSAEHGQLTLRKCRAALEELPCTRGPCPPQLCCLVDPGCLLQASFGYAWSVRLRPPQACIMPMLLELCPRHAGTLRAYFRGNGINVLKIAPETGLKFTFNDRIKQMLLGEHIDRITPAQRMMCGGLAGATAQVGRAAQARESLLGSEGYLVDIKAEHRGSQRMMGRRWSILAAFEQTSCQK